MSKYREPLMLRANDKGKRFLEQVSQQQWDRLDEQMEETEGYVNGEDYARIGYTEEQLRDYVLMEAMKILRKP